ncbi:tRNA dihydrouridine(16) synthase DusC [Aestuariicella hydrocarbonica]|uniref:tRNA-dihydrouridine(16) synthase n=1 Tax=Pseudomaricurvus hydrocarbonicus TaxID=1470433 RepID=A0A9E5JVT0_9GAMM|nr:tRNA-dihydrouridine synthase [Aestuariicella hydrocarbonica]NHO66406.1 tRNA dihydrouridine(16) synthase DusC [Aestuariicella hydrocarbonica]
MRLFLAPMEGVVDHHVRELLTAIGGIDVCVTEFVRVSGSQQLPDRVFHKLCPELAHGCRTPSGTPVRLQLLGGDPEALARNAAKAVQVGATAIDLNFGCPAKTVNNSDGGASLLREPQRVFEIVKAVRAEVPANVPVSAKIRLGFEDRSLYLDNACAIYEAGANELAVHARSKADGYKPPAYWEYIGRIKEQISIPVIANGEIWSVDDWRRCREQSGCEDFMLGRGLLARPDLALAIHAEYLAEQAHTCLGQGSHSATINPAMSWAQVVSMLYQYYQTTKALYPHKFLGNRIKQWLAYLRLQYPAANDFFERIKQLRLADDIEEAFRIQLGR